MGKQERGGGGGGGGARERERGEVGKENRGAKLTTRRNGGEGTEKEHK